MNFLNQAKKGQGNLGTYVLTIAIAFMSLVIGQLFVEILAIKVLGYSLMNVPESANLNVVLSLLLFPFVFVLVGLMLSIKFLHKRPILSLFTSRDKFDWKRFFVAFISWGVVLLASLLFSYSCNTTIIK